MQTIKSIYFNKIIEKEGNLFVTEFSNFIFQPKRIFWITNIPKDTIRGLHAHYETQQIFICLQGKLELFYENKYKKGSLTLLPENAFFIDKLTWCSQKYLTGSEIILSICSTKYNKNDYIFNYKKFKKMIEI